MDTNHFATATGEGGPVGQGGYLQKGTKRTKGPRAGGGFLVGILKVVGEETRKGAGRVERIIDDRGLEMNVKTDQIHIENDR